jgi:hypothetical protein
VTGADDDGGDWEARAVFRDTFLIWLDEDDERQRVLAFGEVLYRRFLESARAPATTLEPALARDLRAAADDLDFTRQFLKQMGRSPIDNQVDRQELELARFAEHAADRLSSMISQARALVAPAATAE